jgi:hypothetical protein
MMALDSNKAQVHYKKAAKGGMTDIYNMTAMLAACCCDGVFSIAQPLPSTMMVLLDHTVDLQPLNLTMFGVQIRPQAAN